MEIGTNTALSSQFGVQRFQKDATNNKELGQEDFLQLIVAQIQNQDPFEPVENGAFIGQLAQFGTVDGVNNLNDSFAEFSQGINNNQALNAAGLIGKSVQAEGNQVSMTEGESVTAYVDSKSQAGTAEVLISNAAGEVVQTKQVVLANLGLNSFTWNGLNEAGEQVPEGNYFLSATVLAGENEVSLPTTVESKVQSVNLSNSSAIELGLQTGGTILFNEVQRISE
ncbi:MAG: flagellar hook capping FlgD N-terminal domain-containing protein [Gammaproteobacteria bacterium]|nr:flagellar hook capping FlgD N-terminal domain-containing protein [Gammaproteobacteria bacterium]